MKFIIGIFLIIAVVFMSCTGNIHSEDDLHHCRKQNGIFFWLGSEDSDSWGCKGTKEYENAKRACMAVQLAFYFADPKQNFINLMCATGCPEVGMCM